MFRKICIYTKLEGFAPYEGQTSSSCRGLVACGHPMGALRAPWLVKLKFGVLRAPPSSSCGGLVAFGIQKRPIQKLKKSTVHNIKIS